MNKKLGPLPVWQWAAIGVAAGLMLYLYNRRQGAGQAAAVGATPAAAQYDPTLGPIDPTTGLPFASSLSAGTGGDAGVTGGAQDGTFQNSGETSLAQELSDLGMIESLIAGLNGIVPTTDQSPSSTQDHPAAAIGTAPPASPAPGFAAGHRRGHEYFLPGTGWVSRAKYLAATTRTAVTKPKHNPGHTVKTEGGKHSPASSAPHSKNQHANVAPPAHQRHETTSHPTAGTGKLVHAPTEDAKPRPRVKPKPKKKARR